MSNLINRLRWKLARRVRGVGDLTVAIRLRTATRDAEIAAAVNTIRQEHDGEIERLTRLRTQKMSEIEELVWGYPTAIRQWLIGKELRLSSGVITIHRLRPSLEITDPVAAVEWLRKKRKLRELTTVTIIIKKFATLGYLLSLGLKSTAGLRVIEDTMVYVEPKNTPEIDRSLSFRIKGNYE